MTQITHKLNFCETWSQKKRGKMADYRRRISRESSEIVYAAEYGDYARVEQILKTAPKLVNAKTSAGWSATHMAARYIILFSVVFAKDSMNILEKICLGFFR